MDVNKVLVLHTGGTISMTYDPVHEAVKPGQDHPLRNLFSSLTDISIVEEELFNYPSPHMTPSLMLTLAKRVKLALATNEYSGVVITHGTDTLEETAYLLDLLLDVAEPVVLTGAMRSSNELGADGPLNYRDAIHVAACREARNRGVLVVFQNEIHAAKLVNKQHTSHVGAFRSIPFGPLGHISQDRIQFNYSLPQSPAYQIEQLTKKVILLKAVAGMENDWVEALVDAHPDGIVFEAFGLGNLPHTILPALSKAVEQNIPIVVTSRCLEGHVDDLYHYPGGGKHLKELGIILARGISGPKARLKLMVALEHCSDPRQLPSYFNEP